MSANFIIPAGFFANNRRPDGTSSVHLFKALFHLCGATKVRPDRDTQLVVDAIGEHDHYLFVLVDGMGTSIESAMQSGGWFKSSTRLEINSVYPSTTAVALTSQASGLWPAEHGITGWNTHLPDRGLTVVPLKATERKSGKPIKQLDIPFREVVRPDSLYPRMKHGPRVFMKKNIRGGWYARWGYEGITRTGTKTVSQGFSRVAHRLKKINSPSLTHYYIEDVDSQSHRNGPGSPHVAGLLNRIDRELAVLADLAGPKVRIIVSADHGHIDVPTERLHILNEGDPILELLMVPPTGDSRNPIFHVIEGREQEFSDQFSTRFGDDFILASPESIEKERLMGPIPLADVTRERLGTYVGLAVGSSALEYIARDGVGKNHHGMHGGLSKDEIQVPLFIL